MAFSPLPKQIMARFPSVLAIAAALLLLSLHQLSLGFAPPSPPSSSRIHDNNHGSRLRFAPLSAPDAQELIRQFTNPQLYEHVATGGALALAGDVIAQSLLSESEEKTIPPKDWDVVRTAAFVTFGAIYTGGAQHFVFGFLNSSFESPLVRLATAQFFFIPFFYYPAFLLMVPALRAGWESDDGFGSEGARRRREELFNDVAGKIPPTLLRNWCFWLPVQFVQFNFIPADLHVLFTSSFGVVWNAILSWSTSAAAEEEA